MTVNDITSTELSPPAFACIQVFRQLLLELHTLSKLIDDPQQMIWIWLDTPTADESAARTLLKSQLFDLWHEDGQDGRRTRNLIGLVGASEALLEQARQINHAKLAFKQAIHQLMEENDQSLAGFRQAVEQRHPAIAHLLNHHGLARLHLKQCYRTIPVLHRKPDKASYSWYNNGRSIKKLSPADAHKLLCQFDTSSPHIQTQLNLLGHLGSDTAIAQVQSQAPLLRANLVFKMAEQGDIRKAMNVALPLFFPLAKGEQPPLYKCPPAPPSSKRTRSPRNDAQIEDHPFLPSIRGYLYKQRQGS
ncbi:DNA replication terminus site-binding protein [Pokkaliibacter plantistimulans]|uniref:DNA replication terminus site-binding protein n=1 Tax=Proteobacteria bacterium 228 TaxID=2083153 RepID=A0A2S5KHR9_9PROT|nr:DNA replication terminus site-binding protein [Pokkaliibacter plantistimulans]PPC74143.1 DNA replication terminus site-binding protein [Pokkaliibacter plantistimulans]